MNPKNPQNPQPVLFEMDPPTELVQHDAGGKARPAWPKDSTVSAVFSDCQRYRYQLREVWDPGRPMVLWLLMNPSVACLNHADPTLRKPAISRGFGAMADSGSATSMRTDPPTRTA